MEGPTPYRAGKPLAEIIPPDRRRLKMAVLVLASMTFGICLWVLGGMVLEMWSSEARPIQRPVVGYAPGRIGRGILHGPGGDVVMPPQQRSVIHVWLQGCQDCMPKFEAMRDLESHGGLGVKVPIINVAYGEADLTWAQRYGVGTRLVFDEGGRTVVRPMGIGTFTTLVVDADGTILLTDHPDRPGYRERVRTAVGPDGVLADVAAPPPFEPREPPGEKSNELDIASVERVLAAHRSAVKRACWENRPGDRNAPATANVTVAVSVGADGSVLSTRGTGDDPAVQKCLEKQLLTWRFPAHGSTVTVNIPFHFVNQ